MDTTPGAKKSTILMMTRTAITPHRYFMAFLVLR